MAQSLCTLKFNQFHESCNFYIVFCSFAFSQVVCELVVNGVRVLTTGTLCTLNLINFMKVALYTFFSRVDLIEDLRCALFTLAIALFIY